MAKRRGFFRRKSATARSFGRKGRSKSSNGSMTGLMLGAAGYGAVRQRLSNALSPVTSKVPLGDIADEAVLLAISYYAAKKVNMPLLKNMARAGVTIESARIGEAIVNGTVFGNGGTSTAQSTFPSLG